MTTVFDEHISHHLVEFLHRARAPGAVQHVRKLRWNGKPDHEWMTMAITAGFAIITADRNERTRGLTAADLTNMGAKVLMLGRFWNDLSIWEQSKWLVANWDRVHDVLESLAGPSCVVIDRRCKVTVL